MQSPADRSRRRPPPRPHPGRPLRLAAGAAGNPLYLTELFAALARSGGIAVAPSHIAQLAAGSVLDSVPGVFADLSSLLARDPARRGILFDRPQVVPAASRLLAERGLADRVSIVAGDFFEAVPPADIYVMSKILHDWDDKSCRRLLTSIATAARPGARLVVLEHVVPEGDQPHMSKMLDLTMLVMTGGKERTAAEFEELFASAGFRLDQIVQTPTPLPVLEATFTET